MSNESDHIEMLPAEFDAYALGWQHAEYNVAHESVGKKVGFYGAWGTEAEAKAYAEGYEHGSEAASKE